MAYMNIAGRDYIWLNSDVAVKELCDKRSAIEVLASTSSADDIRTSSWIKADRDDAVF